MKNNPKRSCQFNRTILDQCSGIGDRYYGYQDGKPCIIIKLNRVRNREKDGVARRPGVRSEGKSLFLSTSKIVEIAAGGCQECGSACWKRSPILGLSVCCHYNGTQGQCECGCCCSPKDVELQVGARRICCRCAFIISGALLLPEVQPVCIYVLSFTNGIAGTCC